MALQDTLPPIQDLDQMFKEVTIVGYLANTLDRKGRMEPIAQEVLL